MSNEELRSEVERLVRRKQVAAVVDAIQQGWRPHAGDVLEHTLERPVGSTRQEWGRNPHLDRYAFEVEAWHLAEADRLAAEGGLRPRRY